MSFYFHVSEPTLRYIDLCIVYYQIIGKKNDILFILLCWLSRSSMFICNLTIYIFLLWIWPLSCFSFLICVLCISNINNFLCYKYNTFFLNLIFAFYTCLQLFFRFRKCFKYYITKSDAWRVSRYRKGSQAELVGSPRELRWQSWESGKGGVSERKEQHRKRTPEICGENSFDQCVALRKLRKQSESRERAKPRDQSKQYPEPTQGQDSVSPTAGL